ncbi:MAG: ABC transporter permease [Tenuifilaceae bacterium]|jgi:putative ABC transport system permease protein|nr:ABC transporter permease [Tenuifilaceae bacterium]
MLRNYLKTALRAMYRDKWYSIVNIGGLAIGMCVALLLTIYVKFELSFDKFHNDYHRVYRLHNHFSREGLEEQKLAATLLDVGENILEEITEVEAMSRIFYMSTGTVNVSGQLHKTSSIIYTDTSFFSIFSFPMKMGKKVNPIAEPGSIVITEKIANIWFGDENPIGQSVTFGTVDFDTLTSSFIRIQQPFTVAAVLADIPKNSHLTFDVITSFNSVPRNFIASQGLDFKTFVKLYNPITPEVSEKIGAVNANTIEQAFGSFGRESANTQTRLMPLHKIHLNAKYPYDEAITSSKVFVYTLGIIAILVLGIASINFVNLTTARADTRKREVGVRKAVGSSRRHLIIQFIGESIMASMLALMMSFALTELLITPFNNLLGTSLVIEYWENQFFFAIIILFAIVVGAIGGAYPAIYISSFKPISILRSISDNGKSSPILKSILVVFQFGMAALLIFGLIVINLQVRFMNSKDLGFDKENVVVFFGITEKLSNSYHTIRDEILSNPNVIQLSGAQHLPGSTLAGMNLYTEGSDPSSAFSIKENRVQDYYLETLNMKIVEGRNFNPNSSADDDSYIINQSAARMLGVENPIGQRVVMWRRPGTIIGVVSDYHFASLRENIEPLIISRYNKRVTNLTIRINSHNRNETLSQIEETIKKYEPNYQSSFTFLDDYLARQYKDENRSFKLILSASILAIILSMVGLYALSAYAISRRTKELGVRKILGASVSNLSQLLLSDTTKWVLLANIIALPIGWFVANGWLSDFAYRIEIKPWVFAASAAITYLIALATIAWQVYRAANNNPVKALRYE